MREGEDARPGRDALLHPPHQVPREFGSGGQRDLLPHDPLGLQILPRPGAARVLLVGGDDFVSACRPEAQRDGSDPLRGVPGERESSARHSPAMPRLFRTSSSREPSGPDISRKGFSASSTRKCGQGLQDRKRGGPRSRRPGRRPPDRIGSSRAPLSRRVVLPLPEAERSGQGPAAPASARLAATPPRAGTAAREVRPSFSRSSGSGSSREVFPEGRVAASSGPPPDRRFGTSATFFPRCIDISCLTSSNASTESMTKGRPELISRNNALGVASREPWVRPRRARTDTTSRHETWRSTFRPRRERAGLA